MSEQNLFIAFDNKKVSLSVAKILLSNGIKVNKIAERVSDLLEVDRYYNSGIIIMGYCFDNQYINYIIDHLHSNFNVICIGKREQLEYCDDDRVFKLAVPLNKTDLLCSVEMLMTVDSRYKPASTKSQSDERIIQKAKQVLIDIYSMSEEQAHRYMQKKSMDTGRKLADIARIILEL